ncbi:hypothetical protein GCM10027055_24590 [Janibacter alkaliphilus]|uniref:Putative membrane protein n=1 Tax=Janibacter alkaliphilus TaxID=1069963 RepID=A0A852XI67_9MICO|nr:hypothetical protein [Janibacter alkaliphilus]NYG38235.1 putative membrane protein [Janibacter alkaliphilus]
MNNEGTQKTVYNVTGTIIGALLAAVAIFIVVQSQTGAEVPQENTSVISYNS